MNQSRLSQLLIASKEEIVKVGTFIASEEKKFDPQRLEKKVDSSLVSFVDKEAERRLVEKLYALLPEAQFLAEEAHTQTNISTSKYVWIIDPLDGTTNFMHRLPAYCISVALCAGHVPLLGLIYDIPHKQCYWAIQGQGAFLDEKPLHVAKKKKIEDCLVAVNLYQKITAYTETLAHFIPNTRGWRHVGSAALQMAYVAAGCLDAYIDINLKTWDIAAGILLIEEAGGTVSNFLGHSTHLEGNELLAAGHSYNHFLYFMQHLKKPA